MPLATGAARPGQSAPDYARRTVQAYSTYAGLAIENWERRLRPSKFLKRFARALPKRAAVLDYGCGIGTDAAWFVRMDISVDAVDGNPVFIKEARRRAPGARVRCALFETVTLPGGRYDGIWCNAALIHVPPGVLAVQLNALARSLRADGLLGLTLAWGRKKGFTTNDWIPGRYFAAYTRGEVEAMLRGWRVRECRVASQDGRAGRWIQVLALPPAQG